MRTIAGCSGEAAAASAALSSFVSCPPNQKAATKLTVVDCSIHHCFVLGCSSSFSVTESLSCVAPSSSCECLSITCCGTLVSKTFGYRQLVC